MIVAQKVRMAPVSRGGRHDGNDGGSRRGVDFEQVGVALLARTLREYWHWSQRDLRGRASRHWVRGRIAGGASAGTFARRRPLSCAASPGRPACSCSTSVGASSCRMGLIEWGLVVRVKFPIRTLAGLARWSRHTHKSLIQRKVVTNGILKVWMEE